MNQLRYLTLFLLLLAGPVSAQAPDSTESNSDVPYGVASAYLYGRYQLAEGNVDEALRSLHFVYRTHPEVPDVAWDFQQALVAGHYYKDALQVLDKLVADWPDSAMFRQQRSQINLQLGKPEAALKDLREIRRQGKANLETVVGEATVLAEMGQPEQGLDVCRAALERFPSDQARLYLTMALILDQKGDGKALAKLLDEAVGACPDSPQIRDIHIRNLVNSGQEKKALKAARKADEYFAGREPLDNAEPPAGPDQGPPSFVVDLADQYSQQGNPEKAIRILEPLARKGELGLEPSLWLARLYLGTGATESGNALVQEILKEHPHNGEAWFIQGRALEYEGQLDEALADFQKGVRYAPDDPQTNVGYLRGMLLAWERDFQARDKTPDQLTKLEQLKTQAQATARVVPDGDTEGQLILGYAFRGADQMEEAADAFRKAAVAPDLAVVAALQLSVCLDTLHREKEAREVLENLLKKNPANAEVANSLGYFLAEKGEDLDYALKLIDQALKSNPGTGAYLDSMGWVLYRQGKLDDAFDYMIKAVNVLPDDPVILEHLGMVLQALGKVDEAREMLTRALALGGDPARLEESLKSLSAGTGGR